MSRSHPLSSELFLFKLIDLKKLTSHCLIDRDLDSVFKTQKKLVDREPNTEMTKNFEVFGGRHKNH